MLPGSSIDTLDPEGPEVPFLLLPIPIGIGHPFLDRVLCDRMDVLSSPEITFSGFQDFLSSSFRCDCIYRSWHDSSFFGGQCHRFSMGLFTGHLVLQ